MSSIATDLFVTRILLAAALSAAIGLEHEYRQKPAGLRTNMLIGIGSAILMILSLAFAQGTAGSADRVAAQIVTGIGFLEAGAIMRSSHSVHGMTTAAIPARSSTSVNHSTPGTATGTPHTVPNRLR